jgi:hypothetical protein
VDHGARTSDAKAQGSGTGIGRAMGAEFGSRFAPMVEIVSVKDSDLRIEKPTIAVPLKIELRTSRNQERKFVEESSEFEQRQSCVIQDNQVVESRDLLDKSEGQPSIPTFTARAARSLSVVNAELVHADGDDPLVKQEAMSQPNCEEPKITVEFGTRQHNKSGSVKPLFKYGR